MMIQIREYVGEDGGSPFAVWFAGLNTPAALKVRTVVARLETGNFSTVRGVGAGVFESRIDFGPGYRVYFGKDGEVVVILLGGGTKKRQPRDIETARDRWADYKSRKRRRD